MKCSQRKLNYQNNKYQLRVFLLCGQNPELFNTMVMRRCRKIKWAKLKDQNTEHCHPSHQDNTQGATIFKVTEHRVNILLVTTNKRNYIFVSAHEQKTEPLLQRDAAMFFTTMVLCCCKRPSREMHPQAKINASGA